MNRFNTRIWQIVFAGAGAGLALVSQLSASDRHWKSGVSGSWGNPANWLENAVPGNTDSTTFDVPAAFLGYTVTFNADPAAIQGLTVSAAIVTFASSGGARTLAINSASGGQAVLLDGGALLLGTSGNPLNLNAFGDDLTVENGSILIVNHDSLVYNISDLFVATTNGAGNGTINVDANSDLYATFVTVGNAFAGTGTINVGTGASGGDLHLNGSLGGLTINATGTVNIGDADSAGSLHVESRVLIDGGTLSVSPGNTFVWSPSRSMLIQNGGRANFGASHVTPQGAVYSINGAESELEMVSGASLIIGNGAQMSVIAGGTLDSGTGNVDLNTTGTLTLDTGGVVHAPGTMNMNGGAFNFLGGALHVETFNGNLVNQGGALAPGESAGDTLVIGNYTQQSAGRIEIEIGGAGMGTQHDFINVTGNALVDGELQLAMVNGFVPTPNQMFLVFNANSLLGVFDNAGNGQRVTTTDGRGSFLVHYGVGSPFNSNQIILTAFELAGDYNANGVVDAADYVLWRNGGPLQNEVDTPGVVNAADYTAWRTRFGNSGSGAGANENAAVPEPATLIPMVLAAAGWSLCRRRAS